MTAREALEQLNGLLAFEELRAERADTATPSRTPGVDRQVRTDDEARSFADTPHYTGDPEWDALEAAETDPSRPEMDLAR